MNKKISTLMMAGLLGAGPLCGSAWAQQETTDPVPVKINGISLNSKMLPDPEDKKPWPKGPYFIIADKDDNGIATPGDMILGVASADEKEVTYHGVELKAENGTWDLSTASWYFIEETVKDNVTSEVSVYTYSLQNVGTGTYLTAGVDGKIINEVSKSAHDVSKGQYAKFVSLDATPKIAQFKQKRSLYLSTSNTTYLSAGLNITSGEITAVNTADVLTPNYNLILCKLDTKTMKADDVAKLNDIKGGAGFNLEFDGDGVVADDSWSESEILSKLNLKAFWVDGFSSLDGDANKNIPQGVYFAVVDENLPASLLGKDKIETVEEFKACTFVAIDPVANNAIHEAKPDSEQGYELTTVKASEMNFFTGASTPDDDLSAGDEVYVGNACFTLEVPDALTAPEAFNIKVANYRALKSEEKNPTKKHDAMTGYIGVVNDQHVNYLVTTSTATLTFEATNTTIMDGDALIETFLQKENVASIYTIQFVSGEDKEGYSEYEQYLTNMRNASGFDWASTVNYNEADPAYQFVVTAIDKTNKTITFNNRQTKEALTVQVYENEDGVYTIYADDDEKVYVESANGDEDENVIFKNNVLLTNTEVVLTQVTDVDKYATFVNRADDLGLVHFELAKSTVSGTAFYVGGEQNDEGELFDNGVVTAYTNADDMTQFELIKTTEKVNGKDKEIEYAIWNKYIYLKDNRIVTGGNDSVAYYSYKIRVFEPTRADGKGLYLTYSSGYKSGYKLVETTETSATPFVIKENVDGSVALIYNKLDLTDVTEYAYTADAKKDKDKAWKSDYFYELSNKIDNVLKTFMVEEAPAISYEAVPQHVSFAAVPGGFLTRDENNDARLAIATEASEDLTFWLDTVHSDKQIPSFYIKKAGAYLYNPIDSAKYYNERDNYRFNLENRKYAGTTSEPVVAKLIFKSGELISSTVMETVVDGKTYQVAEKENYSKDILGNLGNFQFQIILADDSEDEYLIRQGNNYVCQYGNFFFLRPDKEAAYRFIIEKQSAPTANDEISASEVKVIAGNGQITIAGAAGKKVVVSNILGQVVANTVITSDNATIAAPQGIVVVAVEGEEAVKAIVK